MPAYEVYATRWDNPHVVEELIPARGVEFSLPLSDHGEASFSATVEPARSFWRPSISVDVSGVLICRDGVPVWSGRVWSETQSGPRTFDFKAAEWGSQFEVMTPDYSQFHTTPPTPKIYDRINDHIIFRDLISTAQAIAGQNIGVTLGTSLGAVVSTLTINPWDDTRVEALFRQLATADAGPEWYFQTGGTLENPTRVLMLADRHGRSDAQTVLEYVETLEPYEPPGPPPIVTLLGNLFPGPQPQAVIGARGGNVIAHPARAQDASQAATAAIAYGGGDQAARLRAFATATDLLAAGFPRQTRTAQYQDVTVAATLQRHVNADLASARGVVTSYTLTTFEDDPDWTQIQRGDTVRVELNTDVYGGDNPLIFESRVLDMVVGVADDGPAQVNWHLATIREL